MDPTLAEFAGPYGRMGAPRRVPPPIAPEDLPPIDVVLISHNHYDHLCDATIARMMTSGQAPRFVVPLGLKAWFDARNIAVRRGVRLVGFFVHRPKPVRHAYARTALEPTYPLGYQCILMVRIYVAVVAA